MTSVKAKNETFLQYVRKLPSFNVPETSEYAILSSKVEENNYNKSRPRRVVDFAYSSNYIYFYNVLSKQNNTFKVLLRIPIENTLSDLEKELVNYGVIRDKKGLADLFEEIGNKYGNDIHDIELTYERRRTERVNSLLAKDFIGDILDEYERSRRNNNSKNTSNIKTYIEDGNIMKSKKVTNQKTLDFLNSQANTALQIWRVVQHSKFNI